MLELVYNDLLSACDIYSVCNYIEIPGVNFSIYENAPGCDTPEQVIAACLTGNDEISKPAEGIQIFPNPANQKISIISSSELEEVNIYSQTGLKVLNQFSPGNIINVSSLRQGLYFIEIRTVKNTFKQKLMIR